MKSYGFDNWTINNDTKPFLFFIQSIEEMLFTYGHDSYKVPALNFHFLCVEILSCIEKIESNVVDRGNLKPLIDELESMFSIDLVASKLYGTDFNRLFYYKNENGEYSRDVSKVKKEPSSEFAIKVIQKNLDFLLNDMFVNNLYYTTLKAEIEKIISDNNFDIEKQKILSSLSRLLLTELINQGYTQEYIYSVIIDRYYSKDRRITDGTAEVHSFWSLFSFDKKNYSVILPIKRTDVKKLLEHFQNVEITENENGKFANSCKWLAKMKATALDPFGAYKNATSFLSFCVALKRFNIHACMSYYFNRAIVVDDKTDKAYSTTKPASLLVREKNRTEQQTYARIDKIIENIPVIGEKLINVINLHSSAMDSRNVSNQLLNLWTIIEVLIDVEKNNSYSKINQISNTLTTVLNASYVYSLIQQLILDLRHCRPDFDERHLRNISKGNDEAEKIVALLVLPEYENNKADLIHSLENYPLLQYRINNYSEQFSNRKELEKFLRGHRKRLEWQIMRIYRNRNMIVHDGTHFPYVDLVVQNLHFYIDSLIDTVNYYVLEGYETLDIVFAKLSHKEFEYLSILNLDDCEKQPLPIVDNFAEVVLGKSYVKL